MSGRTARGMNRDGPRRFRSALSLARAAALCLCMMAATKVAIACSFHTYKPEKTPIDLVIESDHLVIARSDPENPFAYRVVETLRDGGRDVVISQLVDSTTRKRLATNPDEGVLFAFGPERAGWRSVAYLTPGYRQVVDSVMSGMARWKAGYDPARLAIFETLQNDPDPTLRELAIREFDNAPYALLRGIDLTVPAQQLIAGLWTQQGYPYQSIRILLLGLSGEDTARGEVYRYIDRIADRDWAKNLGAFATALVELDGTDGLARLEAAILSDPRQPLDKLEQVVEALAIHNGVGTANLRAAIDATLGRLLEARPEAAALIARQFGTRQDWSQAESLAALVVAGKLPHTDDVTAVAGYVTRARNSGRGSFAFRQGV